MLVLSRRIGESIIVDGQIRFKIIDFTPANGEPASVRIGVDAPDDMRIDREEIHWKRKAKGQE